LYYAYRNGRLPKVVRLGRSLVIRRADLPEIARIMAAITYAPRRNAA
jgi:hypothetical protein